MPSFTAPDYGQVGEPSVNGIGTNQTEGSPAAPGATPTPTPTTAINGDKAVLAKLNRSDWVVVSKSTPGPDGASNWVIAGPNGQSDMMVVGGDGSVIAPPTKNAEKPSPTDKPPSKPEDWVTITDGSGNPIARQDPATRQIVDLAKPPTPRTDTPAETQNASTAATRAGTEANSVAETARHNAAEETRQNSLLAAQNAKDKADEAYRQADLDYKSKLADIDQKYKDGTLSIEAAKLEVDKAHLERQDAATEVTNANNRYRDEQTAAYQQGSLANANDQNTETARAHQATEAQAASNAEDTRNATALTAMGTQMRDEQAARDAAAQRGEGLLKDRATLAQGTNDTLFQGAAGARNYGLGSSADISQLPQAAQGWATDMLGGQGIFDQAIKQVHDANPALSGTPQGAAYASLLSQVMSKKAQAEAGGFTAPQPDTPAAPTPDAPNPSDPAYLGKVIGAAVAHITQPDFAQSGIPEGTSRGFTAP